MNNTSRGPRMVRRTTYEKARVPKRPQRRLGASNRLYVLLGAAAAILGLLSFFLVGMGDPASSDGARRLMLYCAAGIRPPVEQIAADYEAEYGVSVQLTYGGTNTLLSQIEVARTGDLFLAADDSYIKLAQQKDLVKESIPLALIRPVIAVRTGNPKNIRSIDDLLRDDVITALGNPDQAAIGRKTRKLLTASGHWQRLKEHVTNSGVFLPTVPEVANNLKIGGVDAGVIWDSTVQQYSELEAVHTPELDAGLADITIGVMTSSQHPTAALRFARYLGARDKGLSTFAAKGFEPVAGDKWAEVPELNFFCGTVNRRAVEAVVQAFEQREGVRVNTIYDGCGILTARMRSIGDQKQSSGFPDSYLACDRYYLETVKEMFQEGVDISDTEVVIAVPKGNPKNIRSLLDLSKPDVRITVGQSDQCTIGVLTRRLLKAEGLYDEVMANVVAEKPTSAMLVPDVITGAVDATLAYATDTKAERDKVESIRIDSPYAKAIQPFSIARSSDSKHLVRRLFQSIAESRAQFEAAGFHWRLNAMSNAPNSAGRDSEQ